MKKLNITFIGLTITSSWGNGHATTFRSLIKALNKQGHSVTFFENDVEWYAINRDMPDPEFCKVILYKDFAELKEKFTPYFEKSDFIIIGSYVNEGVKVGEWIVESAKQPVAFYDIDTPVTLAKLQRNDFEYLNYELIPKYDLYLSFSGGKILNYLEYQLGSPAAKPLYCSVDIDYYFPEETEKKYDLGYLGTYSDDRQPSVKRFLIDPAKKFPNYKFAIAGPNYPDIEKFPKNIKYFYHLPPAEHRLFYNQQKFTLNVTRSDMIEAGYSPSVRLFEAAACGVPIISDYWEGLETFFDFNEEILVAKTEDDIVNYLQNISDEERKNIGSRARKKILQKHTSAKRAEELEKYIFEMLERKKVKL